jgi:uncharacterized protein YggE
MPMRTPLVLAALLLSLPVAAPAQVPPPPDARPAPRVIRVTGDGRVTVRPDVAVLFTGVEATGKDLARVTKDASAQMRRVLTALAQAGIPEKDVQTSRHDVRVDRPWEKGRPGPIVGYTVTDEVRVTIRDLNKLGPVIERVLAAGSNTLRSLSFEKEDPTPERARALAQAFGAARAKAEALAKAAGVTLGEVVSVTEAAQDRPLPMYRMAMQMDAAESAGAPVSAGEVEITGMVEATFGIR